MGTVSLSFDLRFRVQTLSLSLGFLKDARGIGYTSAHTLDSTSHLRATGLSIFPSTLDRVKHVTGAGRYQTPEGLTN